MFTHQDQNGILSAKGGNNRKSAGPFSQEDEYMGINFCHLPSTFFTTDNSHSHFEQQRNSSKKKKKKNGINPAYFEVISREEVLCI